MTVAAHAAAWQPTLARRQCEVRSTSSHRVPLPAIAASLQRVRAALDRRPERAVQADAPALACWDGDMRVRTSHPAGATLVTDMPAALGGNGQDVTPGWLHRAGLASCTATAIAMTAAAEGIALDTLEVRASSRSDTRGLLGMQDASGDLVDAAPFDVTVSVRIAARGVDAEQLRALAARGCACSPIQRAAACATPLALTVDVIGS
ncbi:MAG: OsmC family protein [Proteobacteria bacterium]|nr:OsmC family protein [Pseudomonadota bacterium]